MSALIKLLFLPLNAFFGVIQRYPIPCTIAGCVVAVLSFITHHGAIGAGMIMAVGMVVVWLDERRNRRLPEQGIAAGD